MSAQQYPHHPRTPTPTPVTLPPEVPQTRWARIYVFPRTSHARLRYVPVRPGVPAQTREEPRMHGVWSCPTSYLKMHVVRVKYAWEVSWDYYEIKFSIPIIPGFSRGNAALHRLQHCPAFVGEVVVIRRAGLRLHHVANMRTEDRRKAEVAVTSILRTAMGLDGRYRGAVNVQYMESMEALNNLD